MIEFRMIHVFLSHIKDAHSAQRTLINEIIGGVGDAVAIESQCSENYRPNVHIEWLDS